jgi:adenylate cyclase
LGACSHEILEAHGTVDKYVGDAIMAFWGAPEPNPQHALAACTAAVRCQQTVKRLAREWEERGLPRFGARIGIHTGEAVVGNIGSAARLNYTLIGDAVNLASRLEGLNKYYGTAIMISETTFQEAKAVVARPLDWVSVKGKTQAVLVYELLGLKGEASRDDENLVELYSRALAHYRAQDWASGLQLFEQVLQLRPGDPPGQQMIGRCHTYAVQGPGNDWDGIYRPDAK